jgi:hypothetical protein
MAQCDHQFVVIESTGEVRCSLCWAFDDEMQLFNKAMQKKEKMDEFYATQVSFE